MDELALLPAMLTSVGLGLTMGLERERRAGANAGLRTFGLVALAGTVSALLAQEAAMPWLIPAVALGLVLMMIAADLHPADPDAKPDTTTTVALLLCFLFGVMLGYGFLRLTVALALCATALLYFKSELHDVSHRLTRQDMVSFLQFALISFVVLPVLPDEGFGPYGQLNPFRIWLMVVLTSGLSLAGYAVLRIARQASLVPLLGFLGGLVSSTATTLVFAREARRHPAQPQAQAAIAVILIANLVLLVRIAVVTVVVAPALLGTLVPVLASGLVIGMAVPLAGWVRLARSHAPLLELANPVRLRHALGFGAGYAVVLVLGSWLHDHAGAAGVYGLAAVSGLADMDAITLSTLQLFVAAQLTAAQACRAIVVALAANMALKATLVLVLAGRAPARAAAVTSVLVRAGLAAGLLIIA
jgi:uncharacterized membrane protein (DUF4010 family)